MALMDRIFSNVGARSRGRVERYGWEETSWESRGVDKGASVEM